MRPNGRYDVADECIASWCYASGSGRLPHITRHRTPQSAAWIVTSIRPMTTFCTTSRPARTGRTRPPPEDAADALRSAWRLRCRQRLGWARNNENGPEETDEKMSAHSRPERG